MIPDYSSSFHKKCDCYVQIFHLVYALNFMKNFERISKALLLSKKETYTMWSRWKAFICESNGCWKYNAPSCKFLSFTLKSTLTRPL